MEDLEHGDSDTDDTDYDCNNQIDGSKLVCSLNQPGTGLIQLTNAINQLRRQAGLNPVPPCDQQWDVTAILPQDLQLFLAKPRGVTENPPKAISFVVCHSSSFTTRFCLLESFHFLHG